LVGRSAVNEEVAVRRARIAFVLRQADVDDRGRRGLPQSGDQRRLFPLGARNTGFGEEAAENQRLKKLVAYLSLDKEMLQE